MRELSPQLLRWIVGIAFLLLLTWGIASLQQSLDPRRVEKTLRKTVSKGDSQTAVMAQVNRLGLSSVVLQNNGKMFSNQSAFSGTGLNPANVRTLVSAKGQEGYPFSDIYNVQVFFFFDRKGKLIEHRLEKVWMGL